MKAQTLTIIGLERTGSSVGLAVKENLEMTIVGYDDQSETAKAALAAGAVDRIEKSVTKAAAQADILVITTPISQLENILKKIGGQVADHALILDFSDLKAPALEWARTYIKQGHYIGARPVLAAASLEDSRQGVEAASATLFNNSIYALMPAADADPEAVETAVNFGYVLGARPYFIDPPEYDNLVQGTDTLPGLLAAALFQSLQKSSAWQDMLRFAGLPFALSTLSLRRNEDIAFMALNDKDAAVRWIEEMVNVLQDLRRLLHENDPEVIEAVLEELSIERDKWFLKRTENKWEEGAGPEIEPTSMMGQMFGGFGRSSRKKD